MIYTTSTYSLFQNTASSILTYCNRNYLYDMLEILGINLLAWQETPLLSKRSYLCLDVCQKRGIPFHYTPFDQGALANNLDPDWHGACNILSHNWIRRKLEAEDFLSPSTYRIEDSHLPHPMIVGDNRNDGADVREIRDELSASFGEPISQNQSQVERQLRERGVEALLGYLKSFESHCTLIGSYAYNIPPALMVPGPVIAHACAFVKKGDQCAWFDANHGEVAFTHFDDFACWFTAEATRGVLSFILHTNQLPEDRCLVSQIYDRPEFTESERKTNALARQLIQKRSSARDFKIALIPDYTLETRPFVAQKESKIGSKEPQNRRTPGFSTASYT